MKVNLVVVKKRDKGPYGEVTERTTKAVLTVSASADGPTRVKHNEVRRLERLKAAFDAGFTTLKIDRHGNVAITKEW